MNKEMVPQLDRAAELRHTFDQTFQRPYQPKSKDVEAMIALRTADVALAVKVSHIMGVIKRGVILPVPSIVPELLGVAVVRGALVPIFNLAALLDLPPSGEPQWFMLTNRETPVAFAFESLEGRVEVERANVYVDETASHCKHIHQLAQVGSTVRAVIDLPGLIEAIGKCAGLIAPAKE